MLHGQVIRIYDTSTFSIWILGESKAISCYESMSGTSPAAGDIVCFQLSEDKRFAVEPKHCELDDLSPAEARDLVIVSENGGDRFSGAGKSPAH